MQGNDGVMMRFNSGGSTVQVNNEKQKHKDSQKGVAFVERCITYTLGKRFLSLNIIKITTADRVNAVYIDLTEEPVKGASSSVKLKLQFLRNDKYGVLSSMDNTLCGSYEMAKKNYCVPPLPETDFTFYFCRETGDRSCFTLEKKKGVNEIAVERVKGTHYFVVGEETLCVKVKITNDPRVGLRVEVEGPVKLAMDYSNHVFGKIMEKMEREMVVPVSTSSNPNRSNIGMLNPIRSNIGMLNPNRSEITMHGMNYY